MIYKVVTHSKNTYELNQAQYDAVQKIIAAGQKFINLGSLMLNVSSIAEIYADGQVTNERKEEEEQLNLVKELFGGSVSGFLEGGNVEQKDLSKVKRLLKIQYDHFKRRPDLMVKNNESYTKAHDYWKKLARLDALDPRKATPPGLMATLSKDEQKLANYQTFEEFLVSIGREDLINL